MTKSNAVAVRTVERGVDPYDAQAPENRVANMRPNVMLMAQRSPIGRIVLAEDSQFLQLASAAGINAAEMAIELASVADRKPEILQCTKPSIIAFMLDAAKLRLSIGRGIYPVPIPVNKGKPDEHMRLEAWVGYKGAKELACRGGAIRDAWANVVYEGDHFEEVLAPIPTVTHRHGPNAGDMKKATKVYCTLMYPGGRTRSKVFTREKIETYRKRNPTNTWKSSPWVQHEEEMWQAKAILHTVGDLPHSSPEIAALRDFLDREETSVAALAPGEVLPASDAPVAATAESEEMPAELEVAAEAEPQEMSLGVALAIPVKLKGGQTRMLGELRNTGLENVLAWARKNLDADPESAVLKGIAEGCARVLKARAAGEHAEPPKPAEIG